MPSRYSLRLPGMPSRRLRKAATVGWPLLTDGHYCRSCLVQQPPRVLVLEAATADQLAATSRTWQLLEGEVVAAIVACRKSEGEAVAAT